MSNTYRVVRLMKNHLYPTYQLHAYMANKKTAPRDGLRLAGLITMEWLRQRLGDHAPEEFLRLPEPSAYLSVDDSCLPSLHINSGFLIDIVSLPDQGIWTLDQIQEIHSKCARQYQGESLKRMLVSRSPEHNWSAVFKR